MKKIMLLLLLLAITSTAELSVATTLDFSKSVTIGNGPKIVVEFTDPDCPFCRKAATYFEGRSDITRHVFFYPLQRHRDAKEKAQYILSQPDMAKAYHFTMSGALDRRPNLETTPRGIKLQEEQLEIAKNHKVSSTPTFLINGRIIEGFDLKKIEEALGPKP